MKRLLTLLLFTTSTILHAQLLDGSLAPDWTLNDIDGNEWNLYSVLAEGKPVILEFTATYNEATWAYHETGALVEFYNQYGPNGTDEAMVFFIESDDDTTLDDINGSGANTVGNWLDNTPYPILDNAEYVAELYGFGIPAIVLICPNRLLENQGLASTFSLYSASQNCLIPTGANNAGIYTYVGFDGEFCEERTFAPSVIWQNIGSENISSATFELYLNGNLEQSIPWSGDLEPFAIDPQAFDAVTLTESTTVDILIAEVNGGPDANEEDNDWQLDINEAVEVNQNFLTLEIFTDEYPLETYWEILDENGQVWHSGGNPGVFDNEVLPGAYAQALTGYEHDVPIPLDGCFEFVIYDAFGDGICCDYGLGYYRLKDENNAIMLQGGLFSAEERRPFSVTGSPGVLNNAELLDYIGPQGDFCGELEFQPELSIVNLGGNEIQSINIQVTNLADEVILDYVHSTNLAPSETETFALPEITITTLDLYRYRIINVNGEPDAVTSGNLQLVRYDRRVADTPPLNLEIETDDWGYELYWEMRTNTGKIIASGGNENVGPNGGGLRIANPDDPGAYPSFEIITEQFSLPAGVDDCYEFLIVDDYGDGLSNGGYFRLTTEAGEIILNTPFEPSNSELYLIEGSLAPSSTNEISELKSVNISPNPVHSLMHVEFSLSQNKDLTFSLNDVLGRQVYSTQRNRFSAGFNSFNIDLNDLSSGIYFLKITSEDGEETIKLIKE